MKLNRCLPLLVLGTAVSHAADAGISSSQFSTPPDSARPWVYLFPLDGNISSNGITADLEAMQRVGIGGVLYMETEQGTPRGPAKFAGPLWRDLFKHLCNEASRLNMQVNMNNDAGWCGSGGPWITPELSMQRVVWAETNVAGPQSFEGVLPKAKPVRDFYKDIALFAYPTPAVKHVIPNLSAKSAATKGEISLVAGYGDLPPDAVISRDKVINLTASLKPDGRMVWNVPAGQWTLLRVGHTSTGKDNHPAPIDGRGLECDKLSREGAEAMFNGLMAKLIAENKKVTGEKRTLVSTHIDSWEVGSQNWTARFREEFKRLRGYDPLPYLPIMCGRVVDSLEISERFLWDVRMTVNDLLLENYAGHFRTLAHKNGIRLSIEAYDGSPTDDMAYGGRADEPMAEFWQTGYGTEYSCTEMASSAHVYGKKILGAEAFTSTDAEKWMHHPGSIKTRGDWAFCEGINRFVFHRYALQPWTNPDRAPGMSMGPWGLHYERTQTWWEDSKAWHEYLARCQYLLQQGLFVADLCFLAPETSPHRFKSPVKKGFDRPGYNFDGCPPEVVLNKMKVRDGLLVLPDGMSYRMLVLPQAPTMTPQLLRKIKTLVMDGATVVGSAPVKSPSLSGFPQCDEEVRRLAGEIWGTKEQQRPSNAGVEYQEHRLGKGRVIFGGEFTTVIPAAAPERDPLQNARWIWHKEGNPVVSAPPGKRYFCKTLEVKSGSGIDSARMVMTADNAFVCYLNGTKIGSGDQFQRAYQFNVKSALKTGQNLIAVEAENTTDSPSPAGLIGILEIKYQDGSMVQVPTDATWKSDNRVMGNWIANAQNSAEWHAAMVLGPAGMAPWWEIQYNQPQNDPTPDIQILCRMLSNMGLPADFSHQARHETNGLRYIHKRLGSTDIYFVANKNNQPVQALCSFRVQGRTPEFWWPQTGLTQKAAVYDATNGMTRVPIQLDSAESVFVVFQSKVKEDPDRIVSVARDGNILLASSDIGSSECPLDMICPKGGKLEILVSQPGAYTVKQANGRLRTFEVKALPAAMDLSGAWEVTFDPKWGGPQKPVLFDTLTDWSKRPEDGIKYYSGTAFYSKTFQWEKPSMSAADERLEACLDLGQVNIMAEIKLNGISLGHLWKAPFRVDCTGALKPGANHLEIKVVNLWVNRQIGDEVLLMEDSDRNANGTLKSWPSWLEQGKPSPTGRYTFTSWRLLNKNSPLTPSGLIGPVRLVPSIRKTL